MAKGKKDKESKRDILDRYKEGKITQEEKDIILDIFGYKKNLPLPPDFKRDENVGGGEPYKPPKKKPPMKPMKGGGKASKKRKGYKVGAKVERAEKDPRDGYGYNRAYYGNQRRPKTL